MNYMGIDYHKQYSHITLMDEKGKKLKSGRVATARRMLTIIYRMLKESRLYIPYKR
ncbi:MAG: hypothetical protein J7L72_12605 [Candidatus Aminicenantes bacterium]|nr:hypothetical protein [Candidatus Aminicenantes bacterium]